MRTADGLLIEAIGVGYWSGPAGKSRLVHEIDDDLTIVDLVDNETSDILILARSRKTDSQLSSETLADTKNQLNTLASPRRPKLLISHNTNLKTLIRGGNINAIREYLEKNLRNQ
jgi:hypothetical protein